MKSDTAQSRETMQLNGKELAERLGCAPSTLSTAAREGYLVNGRWDVQEWALRHSSGRLKYYEVPSDTDFPNDESAAEDENESDASASHVHQDTHESETSGSGSSPEANSLPNDPHSKPEYSESSSSVTDVGDTGRSEDSVGDVSKRSSLDQSKPKNESHSDGAQKLSPIAVPSVPTREKLNFWSSRVDETDPASPKIRISDPKLLAKTRNALSVSHGALRRASVSLSSGPEKQSATKQRGLSEDQGNTSKPYSPTSNLNLEGTSRNLSLAYLGGETIRHESAGARLILTGASAALGGAGTYWATGSKWGSLLGAVLSGVTGYLVYEQPWMDNSHQRRSQHS